MKKLSSLAPGKAGYKVEIIGDLLESCTATGIEAGLHALSQHTGDGRFARAARAIFQECAAGRIPIDDRTALIEARSILATDSPRSEWDILLRVAKARDPQNARAMAERLRRKLKSFST